MALEVGRVCMKIAGREASKYCIIVKKISDSFVLITGPKLLTGVKRRRVNIEHLEPTQYIVEVKEDASDEEVLSAVDKAGFITKFNLKRPSAAEMKAEKTKEKPRAEEKKETKK